jgi:D-alanyl-D-alanine carboxypeptidase
MKQQFLTARIDWGDERPRHADEPVVPWWSFTKVALATAALQLVAQGSLGLDEPVVGRPFTLRQLLQHSAGVPNYGDLPSYHDAVRRGQKPWDVAQLLDRAGADRLDFEPGKGWHYSNVGYLFVRQIIEEAIDRDIDSALRHLVFDALGLKSVHLVTTASDLADTAWGTPASMIPAGSITVFWPELLTTPPFFCTGSCWAMFCHVSF